MTPRTARLSFVAVLAIATPRLAHAESHKLLVLQSEGRANAALRTKIDAAILRLAHAAEPQAAAGELNFTDAATAVGCKPDTDSCKTEVLGMLGVDEIVATTVVPRPGGLQIDVHRYARGGATRDARMVLPTGASPDHLDGIAPLFGEPAAAPPPPAPAIARAAEPAAEPPGLPAPTASQPESAPAAIQPSEQPAQPVLDQPGTTRQHYEIAGMVGGGSMVALGIVLWAATSRTQSDIDSAPTVTHQDLVHLRDLESRGEIYAGVGNGLAIAGLVVGGISTYFYIRDYRADRQPTARLAPTLLDHGAGVVLTIGGAP